MDETKFRQGHGNCPKARQLDYFSNSDGGHAYIPWQGFYQANLPLLRNPECIRGNCKDIGFLSVNDLVVVFTNSN